MTVIDWLLDSDPAVRWQVMRDLTGAPAAAVAAERARVATEGMGARRLGLQAADGRWGGAAWNRGWNSTMHVLMLLRDLGLDPASHPARAGVGLVRDRVCWKGCGPPECDANPFFAGELEPCINGQVAAAGAYFGQDVGAIVDRLLAEQLPDGRWNCEAANGSTRSSFNTTICVLEALLEYERVGAAGPEVTAARLRGQEYLLERRLFWRRSTGEAIVRDRKGGASWMRFAFPNWWHYDVLRGLDYLRGAGARPDERAGEAIALVVGRRDPHGWWPLDTRHPGVMPVETDEGEGRPSRWNTLRALRVLRWYERRRGDPPDEAGDWPTDPLPTVALPGGIATAPPLPQPSRRADIRRPERRSWRLPAPAASARAAPAIRTGPPAWLPLPGTCPRSSGAPPVAAVWSARFAATAAAAPHPA